MNANKKQQSSRRSFFKKSLLIASATLAYNPLSTLASNKKPSNNRWMLASHRIHPMTKLIPSHCKQACKSTSMVFTKTPDYPISKVKLAFSNWVTLATGVQKPEVDGTAPIKVKGAIFVNDVLFATLTFSGKNEVAIAPGTDVWCDEVNVPQWLSQDVEIRTYCESQLGASRPATYRNRSGQLKDTVIFDSNDARHTALLQGQEKKQPSTYNSYFYGPSLMVSDGWDGRHVVLCVGDSIGFGDNFGTSWLTDAIDDSKGLRLPYANFCVQGTRPSGQSSLKAGAYRRKGALLKSINSNNLTPFTCILSQMGVNDAWGSDGKKLLWKLEKWWAFLKEQWPGTPLIQTTYTPRAARDKLHYYTSHETQKKVTTTPPNEDRWYVSEVIKTKPSPLDGFIDVREAWTGSKTGYLWRELPYIGQLTSQLLAGSSTCILDKAPPIGAAIVFSVGSKQAELPYAVVTKVEGTGPFKVALSNPVNQDHQTGSNVKTTMTGDGVHPFGAQANRYASIEVLKFKIKNLSSKRNTDQSHH